MIEVTRRCSLRCQHCYNNLPVGDREARSNELAYEEHCRILDDIAEMGCLWLLFTGGEIFVRRDFPRIYTYAKEKGLIVTLFTNGTLIDEGVADILAEILDGSLEGWLMACAVILPNLEEKLRGEKPWTEKGKRRRQKRKRFTGSPS